jgi:hypothetical protein
MTTLSIVMNETTKTETTKTENLTAYSISRNTREQNNILFKLNELVKISDFFKKSDI